MRLPLLFKFQKIIFGNGFIAGVRMSGRAMLVEDGEEVWINGVNPSTLAGGGRTREEAFADFRRGWSQVLVDIAAECKSLEEFRARASEFLAAETEEITAEWCNALKELRARGGADDVQLRQVKAESQPPQWSVAEIVPEQATVKLNSNKQQFEAAA